MCGQLEMVVETMTPVLWTAMLPASTPFPWALPTMMGARLTTMKTVPPRWPSLSATTHKHSQTLIHLGTLTIKWSVYANILRAYYFLLDCHV